MRIRVALLAGLAALACACGSSSARTTTATDLGPPCGPLSAHTLAASSSARVYVAGDRVLGCARGAGPGIALGRHRFCVNATRVGPVAVSGTLAAYGAERCGIDTGSSQVIVRRLTDGATVATLPATTSVQRAESYVRVSAIVLGRRGAVAWISVAESIVAHAQTVEVHAAGSRGPRLLDRGPGVAAGALALRDGTVRWRDGGRWRSARL